MLDWMKANPWTTGAIVAGVTGTGVLAAWIATRPSDVEYFDKETRDAIKDVFKSLRKGKEPSSDDKKVLKQFLTIDTAEGSLAEKFIETASPVVHAYFALTSKKAVIHDPEKDWSFIEEHIEDLEKILKKMEKAEKEDSWFKRM